MSPDRPRSPARSRLAYGSVSLYVLRGEVPLPTVRVPWAPANRPVPRRVTANAIADRPAETSAAAYSCLHVRRCYATLRCASGRESLLRGLDGEGVLRTPSGRVRRDFVGRLGPRR